MGYPTPPGERIAYDLDGTKGFISRNWPPALAGQIFEMAPLALTGLNSEKSSGLWISGSGGGAEEAADYWEMAGNSSTGVLSVTPQFIALIFPTPTRLRGVLAGHVFTRSGSSFGSRYLTYGQALVAIQTSVDTTNGQDGTWNTVYSTAGPPRTTTPDSLPGYEQAVAPDGTVVDPRASFNDSATAIQIGPYFRRNADVDGYGWKAVDTANTRNLRGVRMLFDSYPTEWSSDNRDGANQVGILAYLHLYGEPDTLADEDRLEFVTDDGSASMDFSWGDVHTGEEQVKTFRIRNLSDQEASVVELSFAPPSPEPTPSPHTGLEFSLNGTIYSSSLSLSSIPAGSDSDTIYVRLQVPGPGLIGPWGPRILAEVGEWV